MKVFANNYNITKSHSGAFKSCLTYNERMACFHIRTKSATAECPKVLTDSSDNCGSKDNSIWPVPIVESLAASYGDPLACSVRHHLSTNIQDHKFNSITEKLMDAKQMNVISYEIAQSG